MSDPGLNPWALEVQSPACAGEDFLPFLCPRRRGFAFPKPRSSALGILFFFCLACVAPLHARPQVLVILADHLTLADVTRPDLPSLTRMRQEGQLALMSPGLAQKPDPVANVYATLGAGDTVRVGDVSQGRMADGLRRAGIRTALIGDADGDDTGPYRPALLFLPNPDVTADGTIPDPTAPGGKRMDPAKLWAATQAASLTCDLIAVHFGDFARAERENQRGFLLPAAYQAHRRRALAALDRYLGFALAAGPAKISKLYLVVPTPPLTSNGSWNQLTPLLMAIPGYDMRLCRTVECAPGLSAALLTSDTTQTTGLIAARDVAPQLIWELLPTWLASQSHIPVQMTGAPFGWSGYGKTQAEQWAFLRRMDRLTRLNQEAQNPIFWTIGWGAALVVFSSLGLFLTGRMAGRAGQIACYGLRLVSAWPLALLLAPLANPHTVAGYIVTFAGLNGLLALLLSPMLICGMTAVVVVLDGLTGTTLISNSALSEYALSGIRFYGIGNEYMGMLIAGALLAVCVVAPASGRGEQEGEETSPQPSHWKGEGVGKERVTPTPAPLLSNERLGEVSSSLTPPLLGAGGLLLWFALVTFVLSFPSFGAKAGGAITATATFVIAWRRLRGQPVTWKHLAGSIAAGFALVFVWALLSHVLHLRRTHLETAVGALGQGRFGYILGVSLRKIGLAARVALHPGTLLGLLAFALLWGAARRFLWTRIAESLARDPRFAAGWGAGLWGCLVAVLFNDSGIVAAILMLQCLVLSLLHRLFVEEEERNAPARA